MRKIYSRDETNYQYVLMTWKGLMTWAECDRRRASFFASAHRNLIKNLPDSHLTSLVLQDGSSSSEAVPKHAVY